MQTGCKMGLIVKRPAIFDYYDPVDLDRIPVDLKVTCLINTDLVPIFDLIYGKSIQLVKRVPSHFMVYTRNDWQEVRGEKVLIHAIENCFLALNNYYVFNRDDVEFAMREAKLVYPVKKWMEEVIEDEKETYARIKEKLMDHLEGRGKKDNGGKQRDK